MASTVKTSRLLGDPSNLKSILPSLVLSRSGTSNLVQASYERSQHSQPDETSTSVLLRRLLRRRNKVTRNDGRQDSPLRPRPGVCRLVG